MTQSTANAAEVAAAKTLDLVAAKKAWPSTPRQWYKKPDGSNISFDAYLLAGMHMMRATHRDVFSATESNESRDWLKANGWPLLAAHKGP